MVIHLLGCGVGISILHPYEWLGECERLELGENIGWV